MSKNKSYSLKEQVGYLFSGKVIALGIQFLMPVVLVRLIDKSDYGAYLQFILIGQFLCTVLTFALPTSLYFFYPNAKEKLYQLISQTYFLILAISILFIPIYLIFGNYLVVFFDDLQFNSLYYALGIYVFVRTMCLLLEHLFIVEQKSNHVIYYNVLYTSARVSFLIGAFLIFGSILAMFWALVILHFITSVYLIFYLKKNYSLSLKIRDWKRSYFKSQMKYIYPLALGAIVNNIGKRADKFILSMYFAASDFAIYSIANLKIPIVNILFPSVSNVIVPQISKYHHDGNYIEVKNLWHKMINGLFTISAPFVVFFFVIAKPLIIFLYTEDYVEAVPIYRIILLTIFTLTLRGTAVLMAFGKTKFIFITQLTTMILNIAGAYVFINLFGILGAAFSLIFVAAIREFMLIFKTKRLLGLSFNNWLPWKNLFNILLYSLIPLPFILPLALLNMPHFFFLSLSFLIYLMIIMTIYHKTKVLDLAIVKNKLTNFIIRKND